MTLAEVLAGIAFIALCLLGLAGWLCFLIRRAAEEEAKEMREER